MKDKKTELPEPAKRGRGRPRTVGVRYTVRLSGEVDALLRGCVDVTKRGALKKFIEAAIKERAQGQARADKGSL